MANEREAAQQAPMTVIELHQVATAAGFEDGVYGTSTMHRYRDGRHEELLFLDGQHVELRLTVTNGQAAALLQPQQQTGMVSIPVTVLGAFEQLASDVAAFVARESVYGDTDTSEFSRDLDAIAAALGKGDAK